MNTERRAQRPHHRLRRAAVTGIAAVAAVVVVGCGGDSEDLGEATARVEPVSETRWSAALEHGCVELEDRHGDLPSVELDSAADARDHAGDVAAFSADYADLIESAGVPDRRADLADRLVATAERLAAAGRDLADAASDGDAAGAQRAAAQLTSLGARLDELAVDLDVPACGGFGSG